jgi:DNA-binding CsgD family transcriptional regulator/PAS domain-containing protein
MADVAEFSALVGDIYDAALDSSLWSGVLEKICRFIPGVYGNIWIQDANNRFANSIYVWGIDPAFFKSYLEKYGKMNPAFPAAFFGEVGSVNSTYDFVSAEQFYNCRFYKEWVAPQGLDESIGAILEKSVTSCAVFSVTHSVLAASQRERVIERTTLLIPHVRRAVLIGKAFDLQKAVAADFAATVDALAVAICLIDAAGRVVYANPSAMKLLETDDVLYGAGTRLHAYDRAADQSLTELLAACAGSNDLVVGPRGTAIHMPSRSGSDYVAHMLPLTSGARRETGTPHRAAAALVVHKAADNLASAPEVIAKAFGLTPREVAVLFALVDAPGVAEMAEILGLSEATVRTHLRSLFAKTETTRQAELVKLVARFISPVS